MDLSSEFCAEDNARRRDYATAFGLNIRRLGKLLSRSGDAWIVHNGQIVAEVVKVIQGFNIVGKEYASQLVKKAQETRVLQQEKQLLEKRLEELSAMLPRKVEVQETAVNEESKANGQVGNNIKSRGGQVQINLHLRCEEELLKRDLEVANLRQTYTARTLELEECRRNLCKCEIRLKCAEEAAETMERDAATRERQNVIFLKIQTDEIHALEANVKDLQERVTELTEWRNEATKAQELCARAQLNNEHLNEQNARLKKTMKLQEETRKEHIILKSYLQLLTTKSVSAHDLPLELRGLLARGLNKDITSCLKGILERIVKPQKASVDTQTCPNQVPQMSSGTQTEYKATSAGTQTSIVSEHPLREEGQIGLPNLVGSSRKRLEVIDLDSDSDEERENKKRNLDISNALDINLPPPVQNRVQPEVSTCFRSQNHLQSKDQQNISPMRSIPKVLKGFGWMGSWLEDVLQVPIVVMEDAIMGSVHYIQEWNGVMKKTIDGVLEFNTLQCSYTVSKEWGPCIRYCFAIMCRKVRLIVCNSTFILTLDPKSPAMVERRLALFRQIVNATTEEGQELGGLGLHEEGLSGKRFSDTPIAGSHDRLPGY